MIQPLTRLLLFLMIAALAGCCLKQRYKAFDYSLYPTRPTKLHDDSKAQSLLQAIDSSILFLNSETSPEEFTFGRRRVSKADLHHTLAAFRFALKKFGLNEEFYDFVQDNFVFLASTADRVLYTGYYVPELFGSRIKTGEYQYPLYRLPTDLVSLDTAKFETQITSKKYWGRLESKEVIPYYSRQEIDFGGALQGRGLEIVYTNSLVDNFFLHVQGSGVVTLPDGSTLQIGYAGKNGQPYKAIGAVLRNWGELERGGITMQSIREWLSNNPSRRDQLLAKNPSYVFFKEKPGGPYGNLDVPLVAGRSIATDHSVFPKGALGYIETSHPEVDSDSGMVGAGEAIRRFVLNQDTGGAIRGTGRVDLFVGQGQSAGELAGALQHPGKLYFLLHKEIIDDTSK